MTVEERCPSFTPIDTIEELEMAGLWPESHGVRIDRNHADGPHLAYLKAAEFALCAFPSAEWIFISQDDIEVTDGLASILWDDLPSHGVVSLFTPRHAHAARPGPGWWMIQKMRGSYGAQLMAWPRGLLESYVLAWPHPDRRIGADHEILVWCRDNEIPMWFHNPSFVWHCGAEPSESTLDVAAGSHFGRQCAEFLTSVGGRVKCPES